LDFAGGLVVHLSSGASAMVFAIFLRRRQGYYNIIDVFEGWFAKLVLAWKNRNSPKTSDSVEVHDEEQKTFIEKVKHLPSAGGDFYGHSISILCIGTGILWVREKDFLILFQRLVGLDSMEEVQ
jgi:ammonia channel protein AmtB